MSARDLILVGAGPSGLAAAIAAKQRGIDYQVIEQGTLFNSITISGNGYTLAETAGLLGCSVSTLRNHVRRGLDKLRVGMEE